MDALPTEILLHIIGFLDKVSVISLERVCSRISDVIVRHIWQSELLRLAQDDPSLAHKFSKHGIGNDLTEKLQSCPFEEQDSLLEKVRILYTKVNVDIEQRWKAGDPPPPPSTDHLTSLPKQNDLVVNYEFYQDKVFVAYKSERLEVYANSSNFFKIKVLSDGDPKFVPRTCPFVISGNTISHRNWSKKEIELWNADSHDKIGKLRVPSNCQILGLGINKKAIVCIVDPCDIYVWPHEVSPGFEEREPLLIRGPEVRPEDMVWKSVLEMNETYLVTATSTRNYDEYETVFICVKQIHQHRFDNEFLLSEEFVPITPTNDVEIDTFRLSKSHLLAFLQRDEYYETTLHIKDVTNNRSIFKGSLPGFHLRLRAVVGWVDQTIFFKRDEDWRSKLWYIDVEEQEFKSMRIYDQSYITHHWYQTKIEKTRISDVTCGNTSFNLSIYDFWNASKSLNSLP